MPTLHIHIDTYHARPCSQGAKKLTCCTRSLPERQHYSVKYIVRNDSQDAIAFEKLTTFFPSPQARKRSHQIHKKNRHGPASHDLQIKLKERDNKKFIGLSTDAQLHKTQKFLAVDFQSCNVARHSCATMHREH